MNKNNITYRNEIRTIFDPNNQVVVRTALSKALTFESKREYFICYYVTKDGRPLSESFDTLKLAEVHAKWALRANMQNVRIDKVYQETIITPTFSYANPTPADRQECSAAKRACNEIAHQCKNFADANGETMPNGNTQEFQIPEIPF